MARTAAGGKSARSAAARQQPRHHATGRFLPVAIPAQASRGGCGTGGGLIAAAGATRASGTVRRSGGR